MKNNIGNADRIIRVLIAVVFAALYFGGIVTGTVGIILLVVGAVFVLTALIGFCPIYFPFGISTCRHKKAY